MIPSIQLHSVKSLGVVKNYRKLWLAIRKENRFYIRYGMEKDLTSISSVGEKESFLVDCREALLGLKLKGLARWQNFFLSGHKQAQKNRIIAQKQGTVPPLTLTVLPANITSSSSKTGLKRKDILFIS
ncbi:hypothetical protein Bca101_088226 [Brassica carinata]